jgi:hypothetical protein
VESQNSETWLEDMRRQAKPMTDRSDRLRDGVAATRLTVASARRRTRSATAALQNCVLEPSAKSRILDRLMASPEQAIQRRAIKIRQKMTAASRRGLTASAANRYSSAPRTTRANSTATVPLSSATTRDLPPDPTTTQIRPVLAAPPTLGRQAQIFTSRRPIRGSCNRADATSWLAGPAARRHSCRRL